MSSRQTVSELVAIAKCNGDFRRNYGTALGAYLYLRSVSAARGRCLFCRSFIALTITGALAWFEKHGG